MMTNRNKILMAAVYTSRYINPKKGTPIEINKIPDKANVNIKEKTEISILVDNITSRDVITIHIIIILVIPFFLLFHAW